MLGLRCFDESGLKSKLAGLCFAQCSTSRLAELSLRPKFVDPSFTHENHAWALRQIAVVAELRSDSSKSVISLHLQNQLNSLQKTRHVWFLIRRLVMAARTKISLYLASEAKHFPFVFA